MEHIPSYWAFIQAVDFKNFVFFLSNFFHFFRPTLVLFIPLPFVRLPEAHAVLDHGDLFPVFSSPLGVLLPATAIDTVLVTTA